MNFIICTARVLIVQLFILAAIGRAGESNRPCAARLEKLSGPVFLVASPGAESMPLDERDILRCFFAGEIIRCETGGIAEVRVDKRIEPIHGPVDFTVPAPSTAKPSAAMEALDEFFRFGGRTRDVVEPMFFSPAEGSIVRSGSFAIRWHVVRSKGRLQFAIEDAKEAVIWEHGSVKPDAGLLIDKEACRQLEALRDESGLQHLTLVVTGLDDGAEIYIPFSLLSRREDEALERALDEFNAQTEGLLIRHIRRAVAFRQRGLLNDAAAEYDAALVLAPRSRALLEAAAEAHRQTGNLSRTDELLHLASE